ncbi:YceI family protein, partial [Poseidonibacter ostreae]
MHKLLMLVFLSVFAFANNLVLQNGEIEVHTEVFGDNEINPKTQNIDSSLNYKNSIESIRGKINILSSSLKSKKEDRDKNMYELLNSSIYPNITFNITDIKKDKNKQFQIKGNLTLNAVTKEIISLVTIEESENIFSINGTFFIKLTQFNMKPPKMFFLTVRDKIDIKYNLIYK